MEPSVYIILATYNPDIKFLEKQMDSIIRQTYPDWKCIITDDKSEEKIISAIEMLAYKDKRFIVKRNKVRAGVFHNFESGLNSVSTDTDFIFYSDQDDIWKENKIQKSLEAFKDTEDILVHSDLELIDENDTLIYPSCFKFEQRDIVDFSVKKLIVKNSITGCSLCFRGKLLKKILPFPTLGCSPSYHHDLWTALHASREGKIQVIEIPLIQYRQHGNNVLGAERRTLKGKLFKMDNSAEWLLRKKIIYEFLLSFESEKDSKMVSLQTALRGWISNRPVSLGLTVFFLKLLFSGNKDWAVCYHMIKGKIKEFFARKKMPVAKKPKEFLQLIFSLRKSYARAVMKANFFAFFRDSYQKIYPSYSPDPDVYNLQMEYITTNVFKVSFVEEKPCINVVLPMLNQENIFGGISTAIKFVLKLSSSGINVRFISMENDFNEIQAMEFKEILKTQFRVEEEAMSRISFLLSDMETACFSAEDIFVATFWTTAIKINNTLSTYDFKCKKFIYLIQDYEPGFYPWSDFYGLCASTYRMNFWGIYNTMLLAEYFTLKEKIEFNKNLVLNPEIDWKRYSPPSRKEIVERKRRRIVYYGRPGCPRNLFETGLMGMKLWVTKNGITSQDVEIISAGEVHPEINIGNDVTVVSIGKLTIDKYSELLRDSDLGLSLMLSPHPSYPPFDMVASGMIVITNVFENKNLDFSTNLVSVYPSPYHIAIALEQEWPKLGDADKRLAGSIKEVKGMGCSLEHVIDSLIEEMKKGVSWIA